MAIGEVARRTGLRASAIRYYEAIGLLPGPARVGGKRRYDQTAVVRLSVIAARQHAGLTLGVIRDLFRADAHGRVSKRLQQFAGRKLPEVDALITRVHAVRGWLEAAAHCIARR